MSPYSSSSSAASCPAIMPDLLADGQWQHVPVGRWQCDRTAANGLLREGHDQCTAGRDGQRRMTSNGRGDTIIKKMHGKSGR